MAEDPHDRPSPTILFPHIQTDLKHEPAGADAAEATESETPPEDPRRIRGEGEPGANVAEAIDRATAPVGSDDGKR